MNATGSPLSGIVVVDLSRALAGPHAAMMFGDLGARVIKVETPGAGDDTRRWGPPFVRPSPTGYEVIRRYESDAESTYFLSTNRNKKSIALDLKSDDDRAVLVGLIDRADVLVENFRTGVLERLGLGLPALLERNPRLVALSITGFGHDGPDGGRPGYDQIVQGEGGLMSLTGSGPDDPQRVGVPVADLLAGMWGVAGVLAALHARATTGRGRIVRTSLLAAVVGVHSFQGTRLTIAGEEAYASGNHHSSISPYGLFRCKDGAVQMALGSESLWHRFCTEFEIDPATDGMASNPERVANRPAVTALIESVFGAWNAEPLLERLATIGVPAGRIRSLRDVYDWEQTHSQGLIIEVDHPTLGRLRLPGPPVRFFAADGSEQERPTHVAPPVLDQHGPDLRAWLGRTKPAPR
jgi:crotonobetainyl-CoA:carnitine CoA-transferase CaiB-like acyl-CoA transferase